MIKTLILTLICDNSNQLKANQKYIDFDTFSINNTSIWSTEDCSKRCHEINNSITKFHNMYFFEHELHIKYRKALELSKQLAHNA